MGQATYILLAIWVREVVRLYSRDLVNPKHTSTSANEVFQAITKQPSYFGGWKV